MRVDCAQPTSRFDWVIKHLSVGPRSPFDRDLRSYEEAAVTPTMGAITPSWLLVIPRVEACCFADLNSPLRKGVLNIFEELRCAIQDFSSKTFMFEHGARRVGSSIGCGVDQAHVHVVGLEFDLVQSTISSDRLVQWDRVDIRDPWAGIGQGCEYYLISDFEVAFVSYSATGKSQYFRQIIARELSRPSEWDYRLFEHEQNARETIRLLDGCASGRTAA
jgi:ATP adenylyltransferase